MTLTLIDELQSDFDKLGVKTVKNDLISDHNSGYKIDCAPIDIVLGDGIKNKIYEIYGMESHGKSTIALEFTKAFTSTMKQKNERYVVFWIESESALDKARAKYIGCDIDSFLISEASTCEEGFDLIVKMLESAKEKQFKIMMVWDTIAAAPSKAEKNAGTYAGGMAEKARIIRSYLRKITNLSSEADATLIFVNQAGEKIGSYTHQVESSGGSGLKFHASVRIFVKKQKDIVELNAQGVEMNKGILTEIYTIKNKLTIPRQKVTLTLLGEEGLDKLETLVNFLKINKLIHVGGAGWTKFEYPGPDGLQKELKFQSIPKLKIMIENGIDEEAILYMDYLVYDFYAKSSPLYKVRTIQKLWNLEERLFKEKKSELSEKEKEIAELIFSDLQKEE